MNKKELAQMLQNFDHYTQYSDDYSVVKRGIKQKEFILTNVFKLLNNESYN